MIYLYQSTTEWSSIREGLIFMRSFVKIEFSRKLLNLQYAGPYIGVLSSSSLGLWCEVCIKMEIETDSDLYF